MSDDLVMRIENLLGNISKECPADKDKLEAFRAYLFAWEEYKQENGSAALLMGDEYTAHMRNRHEYAWKAVQNYFGKDDGRRI